jgi:uncharacterized protein (TIGR02996 family)
MNHREHLAAIAAAPEDDAPRLAWADAIAGEHPERAELIRLQCREAALPDRAVAARKPLQQAISKLLRARRYAWSWPLGPHLREGMFSRGFYSNKQPDSAYFDRGLPRVARTGLEHGLAHFAAMREACPLVDGLAIEGDKLGEAAALRKAPPLEGLRRLTLKENHIEYKRARAAVGTALFQGLTHLALDNHTGGNLMVSGLSKSKHLGALRHLTLRSVILSTGMKALAQSGAFDAVEVLRLHHNGVKASGLKHVSGGALPGLTSLDLSHNSLDTAAMTSLSGWGGLARLERLDLGGNYKIKGARAVLESGLLGPTLWYLGLDSCSMTKAALKLLVSMEALSGLTALDLSGNKLGDAEAKILAGSKHLSEDLVLFLWRNDFSDEGRARILERFPHADFETHYTGDLLWRGPA